MMKAYTVTMKISSAARTGLLLASDLAIAISNFGKRIIPADESYRQVAADVSDYVNKMHSMPLQASTIETKLKQNNYVVHTRESTLTNVFQKEWIKPLICSKKWNLYAIFPTGMMYRDWKIQNHN